MARWKNVNRVRPKCGSHVLVATSNGYVFSSFYSGHKDQLNIYGDHETVGWCAHYGKYSWGFDKARNYDHKITHWMELPEPPDEKEPLKKWKSIDQERPKRGTRVLIATKDMRTKEKGTVISSIYTDFEHQRNVHGDLVSDSWSEVYGEYSWGFDVARDFGFIVTHWMELPKAPEKR